MSNSLQAQSTPIWKRIISFFFWVIVIVLVLGIIASALQVINVWSQQQNSANLIEARQADYAGTATAIAPDGDARHDIFQLVQFATNTPQVENVSPPTATEQAPIPTTAPSQNILVPSPTFYFIPDAEIAEIAGTAVPPKAPLVPRNHQLVNVVLLGSDGDIVDDSTIRTDTIIIVSINVDTGTVAMLTIPRDTFVYIPTPSLQRINTVYGIGEAIGWTGGGFGLLRETIFYNFGIQVHYHAFVDISDLVEIIDTVGGVDIAVDCAYQDPPFFDADVPEEAIGPDEENVYILPVGYYNFTGREAMWYARSRGNSDAFDRGRRHIQLLEAIFRAARDQGQISQIPSLWSDLTDIVETDVPLELVIQLLPIGLELDSSRIERFIPIRTYHTTPWTPSVGDYAGQNVQVLNRDAIFELMNGFYTPPPESRLSLAGATVAVYNGTDIENLDIVASERLRNAGFNAIALGASDTQGLVNTTLTDLIAQSRGSATSLIASELNIVSDNITTSPDPNREYDYIVTVGETYDSCTGTVLPVE
ncbi:MAG: LCP family protein [Chloroflexota bacterium]